MKQTRLLALAAACATVGLSCPSHIACARTTVIPPFSICSRIWTCFAAPWRSPHRPGGHAGTRLSPSLNQACSSRSHRRLRWTSITRSPYSVKRDYDVTCPAQQHRLRDCMRLHRIQSGTSVFNATTRLSLEDLQSRMQLRQDRTTVSVQEILKLMRTPPSPNPALQRDAE